MPVIKVHSEKRSGETRAEKPLKTLFKARQYLDNHRRNDTYKIYLNNYFSEL